MTKQSSYCRAGLKGSHAPLPRPEDGLVQCGSKTPNSLECTNKMSKIQVSHERKSLNPDVCQSPSKTGGRKGEPPTEEDGTAVSLGWRDRQ